MTTSPKNLLYYIVAFLVGYREETFRELIKRVADVILAPGAPAGAVPVISGLDPDTGPIAGGTTVIVFGTGLGTVRSVRFGTSEARFKVESEMKLVVTSPPAKAAGPVTVTVSGPAGSATGARFTYT